MAGHTTAPRGRTELAEHLVRELSSGTLQEGDKLPSERELAGRLNVSRPVVREVLRSLEERGLIRVSPGRGAYVRRPQASDVVRPLDTLYRRAATPRDVVHVRLMLEPGAARLAAEDGTAQRREAIKIALAAFDDAQTLVDRAARDVEFHAAVVRAAGNPVLETMFASIARLSFEMMLRSLSDPGVSREAIPLHGEIFDAIVAGDGDRAAAAMAEHLRVAQQLYGADLDVSLDAIARQALERAAAESGDPSEDIIASALGEAPATAPPGILRRDAAT
jgi:GntR family transcriptional regulator, transcriptional repressor for pyruvate dehydrogenase complex